MEVSYTPLLRVLPRLIIQNSSFYESMYVFKLFSLFAKVFSTYEGYLSEIHPRLPSSLEKTKLHEEPGHGSHKPRLILLFRQVLSTSESAQVGVFYLLIPTKLKMLTEKRR